VRLKKEKATELLARHDIPYSEDAAEPAGSLMVTVDPASHKVMILLSRKAVEDWGELAFGGTREVARDFLEPGEHAHGHTGRELARRAGFGGADQGRLEKLVLGAHSIFAETECIWAELRFAREKDSLLVTKAALEIDESALFRHPELQSAVETPPERPLSQRERTARSLGIEYLDLDGDLGILPGGIGFGMAAVDIVTNTGGAAANVMDSGGEAAFERLRAMMDLILDNPKVTVAFCCRYAGLTRADIWAKLVIQYLNEKKTSKPVVLRVAGNDEETARKLFEDAAAENPETFKRVWTFFSSTPADNAAREAVALAEMIRKGEDPFASGSGEAGNTDGNGKPVPPERSSADGNTPAGGPKGGH
jgi:succinyl-CoA synthetase beta subunit